MKLFAKKVVQKLELFDTPEKINIRTFYRILETGDLSMLANEKSLVNEDQADLLTETWNNLLDFYYRNTNTQAWENFLRNFRNVVKIQNEITSCKAAYEMCLLFDNRGFAHLKTFGIKSENLDAIKSAINAKQTKLEFAENKLKNKNEGEAFKFYKILVSVKNAIKRDIDTDKTCLAEWVEILAGIAEQNKAEHEALNKHKRR